MGKVYTQLSIEERTMIHTQLERGIKPAAIAVWLNRSASTRLIILEMFGELINSAHNICSCLIKERWLGCLDQV